MEGLYLSSTDVSNINKYYNIANAKLKKDITTLFSKSESLTQKESGVRNLKRCLEIIYTKLNLFRLIKNDNKLFDHMSQ